MGVEAGSPGGRRRGGTDADEEFLVLSKNWTAAAQDFTAGKNHYSIQFNVNEVELLLISSHF